MEEPHSDYVYVHEANYKKIAEGKSDGWSTPEDVRETLVHYQWALALDIAPKDGKILELGCGDGCMTVELAKLEPFDVYGIDIVPLAVELVGKRLAAAGLDATIKTGSVLDLPWEDGFFDVLIDSHCLHCIVLDDRRVFFKEALRVLRSGGMLVIDTMVNDPPLDTLKGTFDSVTRTHTYMGVAGRHFGRPEDILGEVAGAGFEVAQHWFTPKTKDEEQDMLTVAAVRR